MSNGPYTFTYIDLYINASFCAEFGFALNLAEYGTCVLAKYSENMAACIKVSTKLSILYITYYIFFQG